MHKIFEFSTTFFKRCVPSFDLSVGTFLNQGEILATFFDTPDTSLIIKSKFSLFQGSKQLPVLKKISS